MKQETKWEIAIDGVRSLRFGDFETDTFRGLSKCMGHPIEQLDSEGRVYRYHRKVWEFCAIVEVFSRQLFGQRAKCLGFGVGLEAIAPWLARCDMRVLATDLDVAGDDNAREKWADTGQNATGIEAIHAANSTVCDLPTLRENLSFRFVDMRAIPHDLKRGEFDFVWSCGTLEHIGGKGAGVGFMVEALKCLRPGGVACFTTEYNYTNDANVDEDDLCLYTKENLVSIRDLLVELGYTVGDVQLYNPLDGTPEGAAMLNAGTVDADGTWHEDDTYHLSLYVGGTWTTSVAIVVQKPAKPVTPTGRPVRAIDTGSRKPSVLWVGDAVHATGFARCTHAVCDHLHAQGWAVNVLGMNYWGDPHEYPYTIYPCVEPVKGYRSPFGVDRLPAAIDELRPDVVCLLNDPWNIGAYLSSLKHATADPMPPVVAWLAVDGENQVTAPSLNALDHVVVWTEFARDELRARGCAAPGGDLLSHEAVDISIVPLGVDSSVFRPVDDVCSPDVRRVVRDELLPANVPRDAFIVGYVGRNQLRKRIDLTIEYFAHFVHTYDVDDAYLYLHVAPTGEKGVDVAALMRYYGLKGRVVLAEPEKGFGIPINLLRDTYRSFDVFFTTTQGEGWGLPALEAMACGVPVVAPDWSGLASWAKDAAVLVPCTGRAMTAPMNARQGPHTVGGIMDKGACVDTLYDLYSGNNRREWETLVETGLHLSSSLTWGDTAEEFERVLVDKVLKIEKETVR
jgi:glycosyltransferase involved in cell wall biosynthesis/SAM-dependent methyltransferase